MLKQMVAVCSVLVACGGGSGGGAYDSTIQRLMTAQPGTNDDSMIGVWTDATTTLVAVVAKEGDAYRAILVNGWSRTVDGEMLPPLTSLEGAKVDGTKHAEAMKALGEWGGGGHPDGNAVYLMSGGMWNENHTRDFMICEKKRGYMLDMKKDSKGAPVLWISMYGGEGGPSSAWPRTMYFQKSSDKVSDATLARVKDNAVHCLADGARVGTTGDAAPAASPAAPPT